MTRLPQECRLFPPGQSHAEDRHKFPLEKIYLAVATQYHVLEEIPLLPNQIRETAGLATMIRMALRAEVWK